MSTNFDPGELAKEYAGKSFREFEGDFKTKVLGRIPQQSRITVAQMRTITDQWQREEITYSRMVELINEHFGFNSNVIAIDNL